MIHDGEEKLRGQDIGRGQEKEYRNGCVFGVCVESERIKQRQRNGEAHANVHARLRTYPVPSSTHVRDEQMHIHTHTVR